MAKADGNVIIIPSSLRAQDGIELEHPFRYCKDCLTEINKPTTYLEIPCIGDVVRYPIDIREPEGDSHTGKVIGVDVNDEYGIISLKVVTEIYVDICGTQIEHCRKRKET